MILSGAKLAVLATLSLLCIVPIAWESYSNLTHSVLALCLSGATLYVICRTVKERETWQYVVLGTLLGFGALSKYNYGIFAFAALIALVVNRHTRVAVLDPRAVLTSLIALAIAAPHVYWLVNDGPEFLASVLKFSTNAKGYHVQGVWSLGWAMFMFLTPLWVIYAFLFPLGYLPRERGRIDRGAMFDCGAYLVALTIILVTLVVTFGLTNVKVRWLQPLLFVFPVYFFGYLVGREVTDRQWRHFLSVIWVCAVLLVAAHAMHNFKPFLTGRYSHSNYPFASLAEELRQHGVGRGIIVTDNPQMAGNLSYRFPSNVVIVPSINEKHFIKSLTGHSLFVVWNAKSGRVPDTLTDFLSRNLPLDAESLSIVYKEISDERFLDRRVTVEIIVIPTVL